MDISAYHLGQLLGSGSFGEVRLGTERCSGKKVAIKIIEKRGITDVAEVERGELGVCCPRLAARAF